MSISPFPHHLLYIKATGFSETESRPRQGWIEGQDRLQTIKRENKIIKARACRNIKPIRRCKYMNQHIIQSIINDNTDFFLSKQLNNFTLLNLKSKWSVRWSSGGKVQGLYKVIIFIKVMCNGRYVQLTCYLLTATILSLDKVML